MRFLEIPIDFFHKMFLMRLGDLIGIALKVDDTIITVGGGKFARVCVEIDLHKLLVLFVSVMGHFQSVEYEGL